MWLTRNCARDGLRRGGQHLYVAGSTMSLDLPVKNAAQPVSGEAQAEVSMDQGAIQFHPSELTCAAPRSNFLSAFGAPAGEYNSGHPQRSATAGSPTRRPAPREYRAITSGLASTSVNLRARSPLPMVESIRLHTSLLLSAGLLLFNCPLRMRNVWYFEKSVASSNSTLIF
jgi:hypothetical protein